MHSNDHNPEAEVCWAGKPDLPEALTVWETEVMELVQQASIQGFLAGIQAVSEGVAWHADRMPTWTSEQLQAMFRSVTAAIEKVQNIVPPEESTLAPSL